MSLSGLVNDLTPAGASSTTTVFPVVSTVSPPGHIIPPPTSDFLRFASMPRTFEELTPQNFSFNSPLGWCPVCEGLGVERGTNQASLIASPEATLLEGAISAWPVPRENPPFLAFLLAFSAQFDIPLDLPWYRLNSRQQRLVLYGSEQPVDFIWPTTGSPVRLVYKGLYPSIEEAARVSYAYRLELQDLIGEKPCSVCGGDRVREDAAAVRLEGVTLPQLSRQPLEEVLRYLDELQLSAEQRKIAGDLLDEARHRLRFLIDVGLHYLTLERGMPTLSGGESQRIRLAGQIGRALTGVLYVLDEPTIGLHPRDNGRLIEALHKLRDLGNTVVLVEHDREVLEAADHLYDFGPGSGRFGGRIVAAGTPDQLAAHPELSLTAAYLGQQAGIPIPLRRRLQRRSSGQSDSATQAFMESARKTVKTTRGRVGKKSVVTQPEAPSIPAVSNPADYAPPPGGGWLSLLGCRLNNLKHVDLHVPLGALTCVTGLSGSGKSSLIQETLARAVARQLNRTGEMPGPFDLLVGVEELSRVIIVDQSPLGATPASNPATYVGVFDLIRELFAKLPESKVRGFKPGRFSFNRPGGRCEDCEGLGQKKIEMHFLPDVWVICDGCQGRRYNLETLTVQYKGYSISDVLNLSIGQALELFGNIPKLRAPLATLAAIGLDYLTLGQSATTLSGGEAQRVKLAAELCKPNNGRTLYLLDEPTTGLHLDDISKLLKVLNSLVEQGNTVVIIEHNLDVIKTADWIVDMGPEAGQAGGQIVAAGTPEEIVAARGVPPQSRESDAPAASRSWTSELLRPVLAQDRREEIEVLQTAELSRRQEGDIELSKVGREIAPPWQVDGRRWHTEQRVARNGKPVRWEGAALGLVVDLLADTRGLKAANWNDQSTVEITAEQKSGTGWFFHALSGDEWLLRLYFRVPKGTFTPEELLRRFPLQPVDEIDEIQVYGRGERVKVTQSKGPFQEVQFDIHWLREIDTPEFRQFVKQAAAAYLGKVTATAGVATEVTPWKVLGRKWHLSRKGFPSQKRVAWTQETLNNLCELLEELLPKDTVDWTNKQVVYFTASGQKAPRVELYTKRREGIDLLLLAPAGSFGLGRIAALGDDREITTHRTGREVVKFRFSELSKASRKLLQEFLQEWEPVSRIS